MKNRKNVVVAFMLAAVMLLGVGYAVLTDTLTINGTLKASNEVAQTEFDDDVYFSATQVVTDSTGNKAASQILEGRDDATITATHFTTKGQIVKVKFTITNDSPEFDAVIEPIADVNDGTVSIVPVLNENQEQHEAVFTVTWSWDETVQNAGPATIAAGQSKDFWVTITLIATPEEEHNVTFTVVYDVTASKDGQAVEGN